MTTNRTALYLRPTGDSDRAVQEPNLRAFAASRGLDVVRVYSEAAPAGSRPERRVYDQVLQEVQQPGRPWDHLLVGSLEQWNPDERFTRAIAAIEHLEAHGAQFHSMREPIIDSSDNGTPTPGRDLLRVYLPLIASFENRRQAATVQVVVKDLKTGRRATRSGKPVGRPRRLTPKRAQRVMELREQGQPWWKVAQLVGLPVGTCRRAQALLVGANEELVT